MMRVLQPVHIGTDAGNAGFNTPQGYRIWSDSLDLILVLADSHNRIRNLATDTAALWLLEFGLSARRPEKIHMR